VAKFSDEILKAAAREREVTLTIIGRKTGKERRVTIWMATDGSRLYIRSGQGLRRQWPQNLTAREEGEVQLGKLRVKVKPRLVTDPNEARAASGLYHEKYGSSVKASKATEPLTLGEQATFELTPAG
jgi:deazaflavin-dependent oxidoreductase (nitroreductase family)